MATPQKTFLLNDKLENVILLTKENVFDSLYQYLNSSMFKSGFIGIVEGMAIARVFLTIKNIKDNKPPKDFLKLYNQYIALTLDNMRKNGIFDIKDCYNIIACINVVRHEYRDWFIDENTEGTEDTEDIEDITDNLQEINM